MSLLGVSGGGKTTLFNVISGLLQPDQGKILLDGSDITNQPGHISYMLQKDLLLPYRTIEGNVALPLLLKGAGKQEARQQVSPMFARFGLEGTQKHIQPSCRAVCGSGQHFCAPICFLRMLLFWMNLSLRWIR